MIRAGALRHLARIEVRSTTQDAAGEPANTWTLVAQRRAELAATTGREVFAAAARQGRVPTLFRLRYFSGVVPGMRLVFDGRVFNILSSIDESGKGVELLISTEELVGEVP